MQEAQVRALVREVPPCRGATKPVRHNYWACALEPACHNYWARVPQLLKPARLEPVLRNKSSHRNEKPAHRNEDPTQPKIKNKLKKKKRSELHLGPYVPSGSLWKLSLNVLFMVAGDMLLLLNTEV